MVAVTGDVPILWYVARASGVVSLLLLTAAVVLGIAAGARTSSTRLPRFVTQGLHRSVAMTGVALLVVHVAAVVMDAYVPVRWVDAVVPFASGYERLWLGLGTLTVDLILVIVATSVARHRTGLRLWRGVHLTAYGAWVLCTAHGAGIGTDVSTPWLAALGAACVGVVGASLAVRLARRPVRRHGRIVEPRGAVRS